VDDLPGLGVDRGVLFLRLQLGECVQRAHRDLRAEQERLQRRDGGVAPEDRHEPRHPRREQRPPLLPCSHAQRGQIRDRAVEGAAEALPAAADTGDAKRPRRDDVADGLALVVQLLGGLGVALEPGPDVDAELPALVRLERHGIGHRVAVEPSRPREPEPRCEVAARIDDREAAVAAVDARWRGRWKRQS
jgi:hypothetical protein